MDFKEAFLLPFKVALTTISVAGRIVIGIVGVVLMCGGLLAITPLGYQLVGVALLVAGLACTVRAIF